MKRNLLDHLIGVHKKRVRHCQSERLGGLEIKDEFESRRLLDREFRRLRAFEYFVGIGYRAAKIIGMSCPYDNNRPNGTISATYPIVGSLCAKADEPVRAR